MDLVTKEVHVLENFKMMGKSQKILFRGNLINQKPSGFGIYYHFGDVYIGTLKKGFMNLRLKRECST